MQMPDVLRHRSRERNNFCYRFYLEQVINPLFKLPVPVKWQCQWTSCCKSRKTTQTCNSRIKLNQTDFIAPLSDIFGVLPVFLDIYKCTQVDMKVLTEILEQMIRTNLIPLIRRIRYSMRQIQEILHTARSLT